MPEIDKKILRVARSQPFPPANNPMEDFANMTLQLVRAGFRFSVIHNPDERYLLIQSVVNVDRLKNKFPTFNIYLGANGQKIVEKYFHY